MQIIKDIYGYIFYFEKGGRGLNRNFVLIKILSFVMRGIIAIVMLVRERRMWKSMVVNRIEYEREVGVVIFEMN